MDYSPPKQIANLEKFSLCQLQMYETLWLKMVGFKFYMVLIIPMESRRLKFWNFDFISIGMIRYRHDMANPYEILAIPMGSGHPNQAWTK